MLPACYPTNNNIFSSEGDFGLLDGWLPDSLERFQTDSHNGYC